MRFITLSLQNFLSFTQRQEIYLSNRGLVLILGNNKESKNSDNNGSGKSSICEGILWSLYGETIRGLKSDEVVNNVSKKNCEVSLTLEDDGVVYKIARYRNKTGVKKANDVVVEIDGKEVTAGTNADTQQLINTIIGMDFTTFTQSVLLSCGSRSFCDMTDKEQKSVLEDILQVNKLSQAKEIIKERLSNNQNALALLNNTINNSNANLDNLHVNKGKLIQSQNQYSTLQQQKKLDRLKKKVNVEYQIEELPYGSLEEVIKELAEIDVRSKELLIEDDSINTKLLTEVNKISSLKAELGKKIAVLQSQQAQINNNSAAINGLVNTPCPTCKQIVHPDYADLMFISADKFCKEIVNTVEKLQVSLVKLENKEKNEVSLLNTQRAKLRKEIQDLANKRQISYETLRKREATLQLLQQLEIQVKIIDNEIRNIDKETNPYQAMIQEVDSNIQTNNKLIKNHEYKKKSLELEIKHLLFWDKGFGNQGLKSYMFENIIPFLTERSQYYADILSGGDLKISFSTQTQLKSGDWKEAFQVKVVNGQGADIYQGNSSGEKRRAETSIGWALGDLAATRASKSIQLKCLDEMFENLDNSGQESLVKLLHTVKKDYETVLVITHNDNFKDNFSNIITVVKEGGSSKIKDYTS